MVKRSQRATRSTPDPEPIEITGMAPVEVPADAANEHLIVFRIADEAFAFRLDEVGEIIRIPHLAQMPLAPQSLLGLANLRGMVLPVVSLRRLLRQPDLPVGDATRVIVIDRGAPVGVVVDGIDHLLTTPGDMIEMADTGAGSVDPELLSGVIKGAEGAGTIKILNLARLLRDEFVQRHRPAAHAIARVSIPTAVAAPSRATTRPEISLLSFDLSEQEYALPLDRVREIIPLPPRVSEVPRAETAVLGVVTLRDRLLPLVSLRVLLGLPSDIHRDDRGKVLVLSIGRSVVGVVVDRTREILRVDPDVMDAAPALLTRGTGDAEITSICRLDHGRRLVAVLSPERLFRSDLVRRVVAAQDDESDASESRSDGNAMADEQFIIFRLADQEYGLPIAAVDEIARPPEHITRLPKTPEFIDGVMNLRGAVVPIVDLRRRFELTWNEPERARRILVVGLGGEKTGFMVDSVSEVLRVPDSAISPAPELSSEQMRLIGRVANLAAQDRMILLLDPAQLLDRLEADMLAKFRRTSLEQEAKAS